MKGFENLTIEVQDRIALVAIDRPEVLNALNEETLDEMEELFKASVESDEMGAVILTGVGEKAYVAGADVRELNRLDAASGREKSRRGQRLFQYIDSFPKPVIAAINGFCLGGGCELALACHIRIASENAQIGLPEVSLGLIPGYGGTQRLPRLIGKSRALELILSAERINAREAERIGLVNRVVSPGELIPACRRLAKRILSNGPLAVRSSIEAVSNGLQMSLSQGNALEATLFGLCCGSREMQEGTRAFLEKRKPKFEDK